MVATTKTLAGAGEKRFKGVRMRSWGKWVSEIRLPNTRARLWLGSYSTAHQAARAFDTAVVCLRGRTAALNFPDSPPSNAPLGLPHHQIQELAAAAAAAFAPPANACPSSASPSSADPDCQLHMPLASSPETSSICYESEAATTETSSSSSQCTSSLVKPTSTLDDDAAVLEQLLLLDEDQPSPILRRSFSLAALNDDLLMLGCEWDQDLVGYRSTFDSWITLCAPGCLFDDDDDFGDQPCLWSL